MILSIDHSVVFERRGQHLKVLGGLCPRCQLCRLPSAFLMFGRRQFRAAAAARCHAPNARSIT